MPSTGVSFVYFGDFIFSFQFARLAMTEDHHPHQRLQSPLTHAENVRLGRWRTLIQMIPVESAGEEEQQSLQERVIVQVTVVRIKATRGV